MEKPQFEHTINLLQGAWMALGIRFFGNENDASDALQETLLKLWVVRRRLDTPDAVKALGTRIMKNECINLHRRRRRTADAPAPDGISPDCNPHEQMERDEEKALLRWAIGNLTEQTRMLLQLQLYEGMSLDEISAATGKTKGAIKTTLTRAKQQIRQWLKTHT